MICVHTLLHRMYYFLSKEMVWFRFDEWNMNWYYHITYLYSPVVRINRVEKKPRWVYGFFIGHENINSKYMVAFYLQNKAFHTFLIHNTSVLRRAFLLCFYLVSLTYFRFLFFSSMFIVSLHYSAGTGIINLNFG